ncbi:MAG TPA: Ku protein [Thermoanaerobaculia bacterium]|jgi:DNA end-binding protein Ku|nr:Ku protein [Thermoanaerobaculia bacterium]
MASNAQVDELEADAAAPRARALWSGTITFGLVSIPVELYPGNRPGRPGLRLLGPSGAPLRRRYACPAEGKEVPPQHLVRGFEVAPGEHVVVTDEELEALAPEKSRDIDLLRFVPVAEVDPVLFERAYYLAPAGASAKAYRLLADVMEKQERAGIATFVMRGKEYLVAILAEGGILRAETLRFADEVRSAQEVGLPEKPKVEAAEVKKLERAIAVHAAKKLDPDELTESWTERLVALAEKKRRKGTDVVEAPAAAAEEQAEIIDLMAVLKRSLGGGESRRGAAGKSGRGAAARRAPGRAKATSAGRARRTGARNAATKRSHRR